MSEAVEQKSRAEANSRPNWSAVFAVAFCVACLITVEFLPVSLLTPMAQDLGISEGVAGQSVTVTAFPDRLSLNALKLFRRPIVAMW